MQLGFFGEVSHHQPNKKKKNLIYRPICAMYTFFILVEFDFIAQN